MCVCACMCVCECACFSLSLSLSHFLFLSLSLSLTLPMLKKKPGHLLPSALSLSLSLSPLTHAEEKAWPPVTSCLFFHSSLRSHIALLLPISHRCLTLTYRDTYIYKYIHTYIHTYIHIYIYTHIHTDTLLILTYTSSSSHWCLALTGVSLSQGTSAAHSHYISLSQNSAVVHKLFPQGSAAALALVSNSLSVSATCTWASTTNKAPWRLRLHKGLAAVANAAICKREHPPYLAAPIPGRDT